MAKKPTDPNFEQFFIRVKNGLAAVEQGPEGYKSQNPTSTAAGKYQFLEEWLDKPRIGIRAYVKKNPVFGEVKDLEDFKNNPELQEAYFRYYAKEVLYKEAIPIYKGNNPLNLSLDQIGAIIHYDGSPKAKSQVASGKLKPATSNNLSGADYQKRYVQGLSQIGLAPMSKSEAIEAAYTPEAASRKKEDIISDFQKRRQEILDLDIDDATRGKMMDNLYQGVVDRGERDIINNYLENEYKEKEEKFRVEMGEMEELYDVFQKITVAYERDENGKAKLDANGRPIIKGARYTVHSEEDLKQQERLREKYDFFVNKKGKHFNSSFNEGGYLKAGQYNGAIDYQKMANTLVKKYKDLTGLELEGGINAKLTSIGRHFTGVDPLFQEAVGKKQNKDIYFGEMALPSNLLGAVQPPQKFIISKELYPDKEIVPEKDYAPKEESKSDKRKGEEETPTSEDPGYEGLGRQFFGRNLEMDQMEANENQFSYGGTKRDFPIDTLMGLGMGLYGDNIAKKAKIPLRTEEINQGLKSFMAQLNQKIKEGLPVEVEAAAKAKLSEIYQAGLSNIVNASAGNRATVLGNMGQLDSNMMKGLMDLSVADYEASDRAFKEYGEVLRYVNEFDSRRDIANHAIEYNEALHLREKGEKLAEAGFEKMIEGIKYDKENGPGSANDMYRSMLMQKIFHFDPKKKDDGTGKPGTYSAYQMGRANAILREEKSRKQMERYARLGPKAKLAMDRFLSQNQNLDDVDNFIEYLEKNPNIDHEKMNMDNLSKAVQTKNYGLLSISEKGKGTYGKRTNTGGTEEEYEEYISDDGSGETYQVGSDGPFDYRSFTKGLIDARESSTKIDATEAEPIPSVLNNSGPSQFPPQQGPSGPSSGYAPGLILLTPDEIENAENGSIEPFPKLSAYDKMMKDYYNNN